MPKNGAPTLVENLLKRVFISFAALFVNVRANIVFGVCVFVLIKCLIFSIMTVVFPVPAPAITIWGVPKCCTAACCWWFKFTIYPFNYGSFILCIILV